MFKIIVKFQSAKPFHILYKIKHAIYVDIVYIAITYVVLRTGFQILLSPKRNFFFLSYTICHIKEKINKLKDLKKKKNPISKSYAQFSPKKKKNYKHKHKHICINIPDPNSTKHTNMCIKI